MSEIKYTICLTSYPKRFANLPKVLDSLWSQTIKPAQVVLTLAANEYGQFMRMYPDGLNCDVLVIPNDMKVYKKFLYAMEKYGNGAYICVDDDYVYDKDAAKALFETSSTRCLDAVAANSYWHNGFKCHCGALSLVFPVMFDGWRKYEPYFGELESSDMFYTMLAAKNGYTYGRLGETVDEYAEKISTEEKYTKHGQVQRTYMKVAALFGWLRF